MVAAAVQLHCLGVAQGHVVETWRDGDRVRRQTDGVLDVVAVRRADGEVDVVVTDLRRGLRYTRTQLYRLGVFVDWAELARRPAAPASMCTPFVSDAAFTLHQGVVELPMDPDGSSD